MERIYGAAAPCSVAAADRGGPRRVVPGELDLPAAECPRIEPLLYLNNWMGRVYLDPSFIEYDDAATMSRPRCRAHIAEGDRVELAGRLHEARMIALVDACEVDPRDISGFFPVEKSNGRDRLISNRRARNVVEKSVGASRELVPHGSQVIEIVLSPSEVLRGTCRDAKNMYHCIPATSQRVGAPECLQRSGRNGGCGLAPEPLPFTILLSSEGFNPRRSEFYFSMIEKGTRDECYAPVLEFPPLSSSIRVSFDD